MKRRNLSKISGVTKPLPFTLDAYGLRVHNCNLNAMKTNWSWPALIVVLLWFVILCTTSHQQTNPHSFHYAVSVCSSGCEWSGLAPTSLWNLHDRLKNAVTSQACSMCLCACVSQLPAWPSTFCLEMRLMYVWTLAQHRSLASQTAFDSLNCN